MFPNILFSSSKQCFYSSLSYVFNELIYGFSLFFLKAQRLLIFILFFKQGMVVWNKYESTLRALIKNSRKHPATISLPRELVDKEPKPTSPFNRTEQSVKFSGVPWAIGYFIPLFTLTLTVRNSPLSTLFSTSLYH